MRALLLIALAACGGVPQSGELELGTIAPRLYGDARWVDIQPGQDAELAPGSQGGFHIWLRYRTRNITGKVLMVRIADRLREGGRDRVLTTEGAVSIPADPYEDPAAIPNFMCPTPIGISVIDQPVEMQVQLLTLEGGVLLAQATTRVTARCPPAGDPQHAFCHRICSG
jgi:hypothetical protein